MKVQTDGTLFKSGKTLVMGVLNITPDSFSDGGLYFNDIDAALKRGQEMVQEGVDIIDIGGESTRPGSKGVSAQEELDRVLPIIKALRKKLGTSVMFSIDTNKAEVADRALKEGVSMVNSLGGLMFDPELGKVVAKYESYFVIYHTRSSPLTMQTGDIVYDDVVGEISQFFQEQINNADKVGIDKRLCIIDPGIGFGKTVEQNIEIIKRLGEFKKLGVPILIGVSRKSHLGKILQTSLNLKEIPSPTERLEAALAETAVAVMNGAKIVRTHDVLQTKKLLTVIDLIKK